MLILHVDLDEVQLQQRSPHVAIEPSLGHQMHGRDVGKSSSALFWHSSAFRKGRCYVDLILSAFEFEASP